LSWIHSRISFFLTKEGVPQVACESVLESPFAFANARAPEASTEVVQILTQSASAP
jgi:hypothetical protein